MQIDSQGTFVGPTSGLKVRRGWIESISFEIVMV